MLETVARDTPTPYEDETVLRLVSLAREACPGLSVAVDARRKMLEEAILRVGQVAIARARAAGGACRRRLALPISELFAKTAANTPENDPRIATFDLQMAIWWWVAAEDKDAEETREMGAGRFTTAWHSARRTKNTTVEAFAADWFRKRSMPLPEPELAEPEDGG